VTDITPGKRRRIATLSEHCSQTVLQIAKSMQRRRVFI